MQVKTGGGRKFVRLEMDLFIYYAHPDNETLCLLLLTCMTRG